MPHSPIKVGILGAGYIADWHIRALRQVRSVQIVAVCDANASRARSFTERHGIAQSFAAIDEMIRDRRCDAVHVLLPPDLHYDAASRILESGTHVFLEKPACTRADDCRKLSEQAKRLSLSVGVGHNFLFTSNYEQLKSDVDSGLLGPLCEVAIVWSKELGQLRGGPFGGWMFRDPGNIMLEIGPHSVSHLLDLIGEPDKLTVETDRETLLPNGQRFYRRWLIRAHRGPTVVDLSLATAGGFTEHRIHVRGLLGSATADFEAGTYVRRCHAPLPDDFDRWQMTGREGKSLRRQGRRKLMRYLLSKFKLSKNGNDFGTSIARSIGCFYQNLQDKIDSRLSIDFATRVVATCEQIAEVVKTSEPDAQRGRTLDAPSLRVGLGKVDVPKVLVLGGTGFIGQALVKQLAETNQGVRLLVRDPRNLPLALQGLPIDVVAGDLGRSDDLLRALDGITTVCHLARAHVKTWDEYVQHEIGGTRNVAEACLQKGVQRLLYTGTIDSLYTGQVVTIRDDDPLDPKIHRRNLYARAKAESEQLLLKMRQEKGLPVALFRPGIVIGSGGSPFHWGVGSWTANAVCRLWGQGTNLLPLVLVDDVARALVAAIDAEGVVGETFNLVGEPLLSACEYIAALDKAAGMKLDMRPTSIGKFYRTDLFKWFVKVLVRHRERRFPSYRDWKSRSQLAIFDCAKAKRLLKWKPCADREILIREGIAKAAETWLA